MSYEKIGLALSGGIDSLVTGYLLKQQGHPIVGIHFVTGYQTDAQPGTRHRKPDDRIEAAQERLRPLREQLDIPLTIIDIGSEFERIVVRYFTETYRSGRTPNPCLRCNPAIKFDRILATAMEMGATRLATGHYARVTEDGRGQFHLWRGTDRSKDQSYFLSFLSQEKLSRAAFPLGTWTKKKVRELAFKKNLHPILSDESQDVCFIKGVGYAEFLQNREGFEAVPGLIEDLDGNILGEHQGLHGFTVGQRRGINCPASEPLYVIRLDMERNRLVVGRKADTLSSLCRVEQINWICPPDDNPVHVHTRVRYRHEAAASEVCLLGETQAEVRFDIPQSAVTPGQGAVFYRDDEVIGGGIIVGTEPSRDP